MIVSSLALMQVPSCWQKLWVLNGIVTLRGNKNQEDGRSSSTGGALVCCEKSNRRKSHSICLFLNDFLVCIFIKKIIHIKDDRSNVQKQRI